MAPLAWCFLATAFHLVTETTLIYLCGILFLIPKVLFFTIEFCSSQNCSYCLLVKAIYVQFFGGFFSLAENVEEIDLVRAKAAKKRAEDALNNHSPETDRDAFLVMEAALRRSNLRLDVVRRYRSTAGKLTELDESL